MRRESVPLSKLEFDLQNPRFEPIPNQLDALAAIAKETSKLNALMRHIVENGLNPTERIAVIPAEKSGRFTVVEGNRRLAALKLLSKPQLLDGIDVPDAAAKALRRAIPTDFDVSEIARVEVAIFDDRQDASTWIDLKHTGQNGGAGTVEWDGVQTARYRKSDAALIVLEFAVAQGGLSKEDLSISSFPITSLRRLVGDPYVRQALGIGLSKGNVTSEFAPEESIKGLKRVVTDLASGKVTVTDIKRKEHRAKYIDSIPMQQLPNLSKRQQAWSLSEPRAAAATVATTQARQVTQRSNKDRLHLIPPQCKLSINSERLNNIYWELRRGIKIADAPNAVAVLFRAFVEMSVDLFMETNSMPLNNTKGYGFRFEEKISQVIARLESTKTLTAKASRQVKLLLKDDSVGHPQTFHSFVHDRTAIPTVPVMFSMWSSVESLLIGIYK
jgi:hypothetical protein